MIPWPGEFVWTPRSARTDRPLLAFFAGTENSCSRRELSRLFAASDEILVFPPDALRHQEWSELALASTFCLVPDGDQPLTGRLVEARGSSAG